MLKAFTSAFDRKRTLAGGIRRSGNMKYRARLPGSVHLGAGELDDLGPLLGFDGDEFSKVGRQHRHGHATEVRKVRLYPGISEARINLSVEPFDDLGGRVLGRTDAMPRTGLVASYELTDSWNVRQGHRAHCRRHRQRAKLAGPDEFDGSGHDVKTDLHLTGHQVRSRLRLAAVWHVNNIDGSHHLE